jgi:hypothetical protein
MASYRIELSGYDDLYDWDWDYLYDEDDCAFYDRSAVSFVGKPDEKTLNRSERTKKTRKHESLKEKYMKKH